LVLGFKHRNLGVSFPQVSLVMNDAHLWAIKNDAINICGRGCMKIVTLKQLNLLPPRM